MEIVSRRGLPKAILKEAVKTAVVTYGTAEAGRAAFNLVSNALTQTGASNLYGGLTRLEAVRVGNHTVSGFGTVHTVENFLAHQDEIKAGVQGSSGVVLEYFGTGRGNLSRPSVTDDELRKSVTTHNDNVFGFFSGIGKICASEGVDIFTVNPQSRANFLMDMYLFAGIPLYMIARDLHPKIKPFLDIFLFKHPVTRGALLTANTVALLSWSGITRIGRNAAEQIPQLKSDIPPSNRANLLGWNLPDYRDLRTAKGVKKVLEILEAEGAQNADVKLVQGDVHNGVMEYLQRDLDAKELLYPHFGLTADHLLRRFRYNTTQDAWVKIGETKF